LHLTCMHAISQDVEPRRFAKPDRIRSNLACRRIADLGTLQTQMSFNTLAILPCYSAFCGLALAVILIFLLARPSEATIRSRSISFPLCFSRATAEISVASTQCPDGCMACWQVVYQNPQLTRNYPTARPDEEMVLHSPPSS